MPENKLTKEQEQKFNHLMKARSAIRWRTRELQEQGMSPEEAEKEAFFQIREEMFNLPRPDDSN